MKSFRSLLLLAIMGRWVMGVEFSMIDQSTFLDPRVLSNEEREESVQYFSSRLYTVFELNYQFRNEFADTRSAVFQSANQFYWSSFQVSLDFTARERSTGPIRPLIEQAPEFKPKVMFFYYPDWSRFYSENKKGSQLLQRLQNTVVTRFGAGWNAEFREGAGWLHEMELSFDSLLTPRVASGIPVLNRFLDGYVYAWRPEVREHFFGYGGTADVIKWDIGPRLRFSTWLTGGKVSRKWDWGGLHLDVILEIPVSERFGVLNFSMGMTRDLRRGEWHPQALMLFNIPVKDWLRMR